MKRRASKQPKIQAVYVSAISLGMLGALLGHGLITFADAQGTPVTTPTPTYKTVKIQNEPVGPPKRIIIPGIGLNTVVETVGLTSGGSMGVPQKPLNAGWYKYGSRPGEVGTAVIDGHVNWWNGAKGAFEHLDDLTPGDFILVQDDTGAIITFVVRKVRTFNPQDDATEVFNSTDGKAHLNLITCNGIWNRLTQQYSKRLVIFADKADTGVTRSSFK